MPRFAWRSVWDEVRRGGLRFLIHESSQDEQYDLDLHGAFELITKMLEACVEAIADVPPISMWPGMFESFMASVETLRARRELRFQVSDPETVGN